MAQVEIAKKAFTSSLENLQAQQKAESDRVNANDKLRDEQLKSKHHTEQTDLKERIKTERLDLLAELHSSSKRLDQELASRRSEMLERQHNTKRSYDSKSGEELKSFKEGQFRDADAFKRRVATRRVEEDKALTIGNRKEHEELAEQRQSDIKQLEVDQEREREAYEQEGTTESSSSEDMFAEEKARLDAEHAQQLTEMEEKQKEDRASFILLQADRERMTKDEHKTALKERDQQEENTKRQFDRQKENEQRQLGEKQAEERKQLGLNQKEQLKKFNVEAENRRTELANKQEEDRKAMFAARRASAAAGEKHVENPDDKKISPQKERDTLEEKIKEDRKKFIAKQDVEGETMLSDQADQGGKVRADQEERWKRIQQSMKESREALLKEHERQLASIDEEKDDVVVRFDERQVKELEDLKESMAIAHEDLVKSHSTDKESLQVRREDLRKKLLQKQEATKQQLLKKCEEAKTAVDTSQDLRRKALASSLEEELNTFSAKQEEERSVVVLKQKSDEKILEESQSVERKEMDATIQQEIVDNDARQKEAVKDIDLKHEQQQNDLTQRHSSERTAMQTEFQKNRTRLASEQTTERDQHATEHRAKLLTQVEIAQNKLNHALLGKACVMLTAPPAGGKTCLVSQLMVQALNDKSPPFVPLAIRVQQLQRRLLVDRGEITDVKKRQQQEREKQDASHAAESHHLPFDQVEVVQRRHKDERERLEATHSRQLQAVYQRSTFANSWNWIDAYLREEHGATSQVYMMLRQALMARRVLLLLDGLDEGGAVRDEIERHIVEVLAPQGHAMLVTSRPHGLKEEPFLAHFERLSLKPLSDMQQQHLIERRINEKPRAEKLLNYVKEHMPLDAETGTRMTGNPLMLSMIISLFESTGGGAMPDSLSALYAKASAVMLEREIGDPEADAAQMRPAATVPQLTPLLEAIFFRAHSAQRRMIEEQDVEAAALEIGAPDVLTSIDWPHYKGRVRIGQVVKLSRGVHSGEHGVLTADARGTLINGKEPRNPFKVIFPDKSSSGWVKADDFVSSGLDRATFYARFGGEARQKTMRAAVEKLPEDLRGAIQAVRSGVARDQVPLLTLLQSEPLLMQSSHLSFQEFYCAMAIRKGMILPGEPPWRWSIWWANCLRLGIEIGQGFGEGLMSAAGASGSLNLVNQIGGHRPTSLAAVAEMMLGVHTIDLSQNAISPSEVHAIARATKASKTLTELSLAKNPIGDEGAVALAEVLGESKLTNLNFFCTGMKQEGARAFTKALANAPSLTRLNLQYNALRAESKKTLEAANASRTKPLFLVI